MQRHGYKCDSWSEQNQGSDNGRFRPESSDIGEIRDTWKTDARQAISVNLGNTGSIEEGSAESGGMATAE